VLYKLYTEGIEDTEGHLLLIRKVCARQFKKNLTTVFGSTHFTIQFVARCIYVQLNR